MNNRQAAFYDLPPEPGNELPFQGVELDSLSPPLKPGMIVSGIETLGDFDTLQVAASEHLTQTENLYARSRATDAKSGTTRPGLKTLSEVLAESTPSYKGRIADAHALVLPFDADYARHHATRKVGSFTTGIGFLVVANTISLGRNVTGKVEREAYFFSGNPHIQRVVTPSESPEELTERLRVPSGDPVGRAGWLSAFYQRIAKEQA